MSDNRTSSAQPSALVSMMAAAMVAAVDQHVAHAGARISAKVILVGEGVTARGSQPLRAGILGVNDPATAEAFRGVTVV
jgi:hypothetical protein